MRRLLCLVLAAGSVASLAQAPPALQPDPAKSCADCDAWNAPQEPSRVFGNTYRVGPAALGSVLVTSGHGHVLLDGGLTQSAPLIAANIRKAGFRVEDVRLIVNSHAHYDHAGGIAALQRASGAIVAASPAGVRALERGEPTEDDPQFGFGAEENRFPAVKNVRVVKDGEVVRVGDIALTAHHTPGHTPGGTTWTWRSCEGADCRDIVYADSLGPVAAPGFRYTGDASRPSRVDEFRRTIAKVRDLPCDILLVLHPSPAAPRTCRAYAAAALKQLEQRIAAETPVR